MIQVRAAGVRVVSASIPEKVRHSHENNAETAQGNIGSRARSVGMREPVADFSDNNKGTRHGGGDCQNYTDSFHAESLTRIAGL